MDNYMLAHKILSDILVGNKYSTLALNDAIKDVKHNGFVTRVVYGVLEKNVYLEYFISQLSPKKPRPAIHILLKIGVYCLKFMNDTPPYAIINSVVNAAKEIKRQVSGYVNATLKAAVTAEAVLPKGRDERLSVAHSVPLWIVKKYIGQYGEETATKIMSPSAFTMEHARINTRIASEEQVKEMWDKSGIDYKDSGYGGYFIKNSPVAKKLFDEGYITYQSPCSMLCCRAMGVADGDMILDMCAAPGGKSVYLSELGKVEITAADIHIHRVRLINYYVERMKAEGITAVIKDAAQRDVKAIGTYDRVLADVPCSGLGVALKKPDIYLNRTPDDVHMLAELQYAILNNAVDYCKKGGYVLYSTCTVLKEENEDVVERVLSERTDVRPVVMDIGRENNGMLQLLPDGKGVDGFFMAKLQKTR